jgi:hypothetical protein
MKVVVLAGDLGTSLSEETNVDVVVCNYYK